MWFSYGLSWSMSLAELPPEGLPTLAAGIGMADMDGCDSLFVHLLVSTEPLFSSLSVFLFLLVRGRIL